MLFRSIAFFIGIGVGTTAIISRCIGDKNSKKANLALRQAIILSTIIGLIIGVISFVFSKPILILLGAEPVVLEYASPYFFMVAVPCVFLCLMQVISSALRGAGDTKTPMMAATVANILNIILNYILIFGVFGFKGLGIIGARSEERRVGKEC